LGAEVASIREVQWDSFEPNFFMVLSPGATLTEFQESAGGAPHGGADPASVVRSSLSSLGRKRAVVPGLGNKCQVWANRLFPRRFVTAMAARVLSRFAFKPDS
ncbi:MAG: hypothetical protein P8Z49_00780, partial [Acidobacteriota bacterium]